MKSLLGEFTQNEKWSVKGHLWASAGTRIVVCLNIRIILDAVSRRLRMETRRGNVQEIVANRWKEVLRETDLVPIDVHTPMWLWSRGKFRVEI